MRWPRFHGPDDDAVSYIASLIRTEIGMGDWTVGEKIPDRIWLAEATGVEAHIVDMAIERLDRDGWIAPSPDGGYLVCELAPSSRTASSMLEATWGDTYPVPTGLVERIVPNSIPALLIPPAPPPYLDRLFGRPITTYLIGIEGLPFVKIGRTKKDARTRMLNLQCGQPLELSLLATWDGDYEGELHAHFAEYRVRGEWFDLTPLGDPVEAVKAAVEEIKAEAA